MSDQTSSGYRRKKLRRVGETKEKTVDVRFIFATNKDLWKCASSGSFREDLLFRIGRYVLEIPPLRERESDFPEISRRIWKKIVDGSEHFMFIKQSEECCITSLNDEEIKVLLDHHFPGNIRQLESVLNRTFMLWAYSFFKMARLEILINEIEKEKRRWRGKTGEATEDNGTKKNCRILFNQMTKRGQNFWEVVYKRYLKQEMAKKELKEIILLGLEETKWLLRNLLRLFNIRENEYKKIINFLQGQGIKIRELKRQP